MANTPTSTASLPAAPVEPADPQAVNVPLGMAAHFIVLNIAPGAAAQEAVQAFFGNVAGLVRSVERRAPEERLSMVVGIGSSAWDRLFGTPRPAGLHALQALHGDKHSAPSTPGDILLHIRAMTERMCFELAMLCMQTLGDAVLPVDEVHGFRYFEARAMIGFVDGVENPDGREALDATLIGDEDARFAGGSYVIVQKYLHDMAAWNATSTEEQERMIGRTKAANVELAENVKPTNSHSSLNVVEDADGNELSIVRANLPFANASRNEYGTYFIGYARDPAVTELMLTNMFIGRPPGNYDRLLDFSTAVTGTLFFVPSATLLESLADGNPFAAEAAPAADSAEALADAPMAIAPDTGTLPIGSLKGQPQWNQPKSAAEDHAHEPTP